MSTWWYQWDKTVVQHRFLDEYTTWGAHNTSIGQSTSTTCTGTTLYFWFTLSPGPWSEVWGLLTILAVLKSRQAWTKCDRAFAVASPTLWNSLKNIVENATWCTEDNPGAVILSPLMIVLSRNALIFWIFLFCQKCDKNLGFVLTVWAARHQPTFRGRWCSQPPPLWVLWVEETILKP